MTARSRCTDRRRQGGLSGLLCALLGSGLIAGSACGADALPGAARSSDAARVVAIADVHGAYAEFTALLRAVGLVDDGLQWAGGTTRLVMTGDLLDRGPRAHEVLDLLMRLQQEATKAGGQLYLTLGNHEALNLLGDLRYATAADYAAHAAGESATLRAAEREAWQARHAGEPASAFDARFPPGYFARAELFAPDGRYGRWLLAQPVAVVIDDTLFMHGGPSRVVAGLGIEELNLRYRSALVEYLGALRAAEAADLVFPEDEYARRPALARGRAEAMAPGAPVDDPARAERVALAARLEAADRQPLLETDGPNWYRGQALCHSAGEIDLLEPYLARLGVRRLVIGHTVARQSTVASRFDGRVIKLDAGMNAAVYRGRAAALLIEGGRVRVAYPEVEPAEVPAEALYVGSNTLADSDAQRLLAGGTLTLRGPRAPDLLDAQVEADGRSAPVAFMVLAEDARKRELAAMRLDRALGLGMVPASAEREMQGQRGIVQLRPSKPLSQAEVQSRLLRPGGWCELGAQFELMYAFDALIGNEGRTAERMLYDESEWMLLLTGHARAFGTSSGLPAHLKARPPSPGAELRRRLAALDARSLDALLGDLLSERERRALLARRDALLALRPAIDIATAR